MRWQGPKRWIILPKVYLAIAHRLLADPSLSDTWFTVTLHSQGQSEKKVSYHVTVVLSWGDFGPSGDLWQYLSICHHWRSVTGISRVEASHVPKEDTEEPPQQRMIQTQESTEVEKPCPWSSPVITSPPKSHIQASLFRPCLLPFRLASSSTISAKILQPHWGCHFTGPHFSLSVTCLHPS